MTPKSFLLQECKNVSAVLDKTLRHEYGLDGSRDFYEECSTRLAFIEGELSTTLDNDFPALSSLGNHLNELSRLICRIERSSRGEYSWPFVEELKKIAGAICAEATLANPNSLPKVYVLADGGLDAYKIYLEQSRPSASKTRILTIIFPKSLKHFVLLHPILGHEIGHAIWRLSKHQHILKSNVQSHLKGVGGKFESVAVTADWIFSQAAPGHVKGQLNWMNARGANKANFFVHFANWDAWLEEILCDLIGLLTVGPSFLAAECRLLYSLDPSGMLLGPNHPPVGCRVNLLIKAARLLGFDVMQNADVATVAAVQNFWTNITASVQTDPWFDAFTDVQIQQALQGLSGLLAAHTPSAYPTPSSETVKLLIDQLASLVPPVGFELDSENNPACKVIDFRHILFAGWIESTRTNAAPFETINRLCEHAIMQQSAIDLSIRGLPSP